MGDLAFSVLVALTDDQLHGYALLKRLRALEGRAALRTGTVYAALARLQDEGWVAEVEAPTDGGDPRRRYYRVTPAGREAARAEAARLASLVGFARRKELLTDPSRG
jgi:DNA-binding PadR family transcriptional regulator